ncbi:hypothetical protein [Mesorhizobium sp. SEMIA 3007]|nr:hypothetical protein [Mesorhizobium sp. SEMIA 3007]
MIDDNALLPQRGAETTVAVAFEFVADFKHGFELLRIRRAPQDRWR